MTVAEILGERKEYYFDNDELSNTPKGFFEALTRQRQKGTMEGAESAALTFFRQCSCTDQKRIRLPKRFPLLMVEYIDYKDAMAYVKFRAEGGEIDQAAGLVFRYKDNQNYYVLSANALKNNVHLYKVSNGQQKLLGEKNMPVSSNEWHLLKVVYDGKKIRCFFENAMVIEVLDDTFSSGGIGLWTKSDSYVLFDDLVIQENS
ncbi:hypothetical protein [Candidatus Kuenenia stuttgartiensis]|uniref:hypothetical protein n=1 Tax=Kuenenia stuttgartiensis TaxID=174633 RepID=UPI00146C4786|nr:hypothetical protein [Candidatus Kuenenia stuttgartiensis]